MAAFTLNNKLTQTKTFKLEPALLRRLQPEGILPWSIVVDARIGSEMTLILVDPTPFIYQMAKLRPFAFRMKSGLVSTSHGPIMFLLFYVPAPNQAAPVRV